MMTASTESGPLDGALNDLCVKWEGVSLEKADKTSYKTEAKESSLAVEKANCSYEDKSSNLSEEKAHRTLTEVVGSNPVQGNVNVESSSYESVTEDSHDEYHSTRDLTDGVCGSSLKPKIKKKKRKKKSKLNTVSDLIENNLSNQITIASSSLGPIDERSRNPSTCSSDTSSSALQQACALGLREGLRHGVLPVEECIWLGLTGGGCWLSPTHWPDWFNGKSSASLTGEWKAKIHEQLKKLNSKTDECRNEYSEVVFGGSWIRSVQCRWLIGGLWYPADIFLSLPDSHSPSDNDVEPLLKVEFTSSTRKSFSFYVSDILLSRVHLEPPSRCFLALYSIHEPTNPFFIMFNSEKRLEEWTDNISAALWQKQNSRFLQ